MHKKIIISIFSLLLIHVIYAQDNWHTSSKKARKLVEEALTQQALGYTDIAIEKFMKAISIDKKFVEAYLSLGQLYEDLQEYEHAAEYYRKGHDLSPGLYKQTLKSLGRAYFYAGNYKEARTSFENYVQQKGITTKNRSNVQKFIKSCNFSIKAMETPYPFNPVNLGPKINTTYHEYWPTISADEEILIYTSRIPIDPKLTNTIGNWQEDFFISKKVDGEWQLGENIGPPINTEDNEGAQTISIDGRLLFFTACNRDDSKGRCDIYFSKYDGEEWSNPVNLGPPINTAYNEKQPTISPDGKTLYFISERSGGKGKFDIWKSELISEGHWSEPQNLGDSINTLDNEQAPFIHPDNKTLYFTSNGHIGMGGADLFMSRKKENGTWETPKNLGYPINSPHDEMGMVVNAAGDEAYFSSDRNKEMGLDLYEFKIPENIRPLSVSYMKGIIFNADTKERLCANFQIIDLSSGDTMSSSVSNKTNGEFLITIPTEKSYALNVSKKGYLFYSENFTFSGEHSKIDPFMKDIPMQLIEINKQIVLKNIFYETNSFYLKNESKIELNKIYEFLILNPNLKIEIGGHTDNTGTTEYNLYLSYKRAQEVVKYLIQLGAKPERLLAKGYGESLPIATNDTDEGRAINRRTELRIIGF